MAASRSVRALLTRLFPILLYVSWLPSACQAAGDGFSLVARAMQAKMGRTYQARQDIIWVIPPEQGGGVMEIVTLTARAGMRSRTTYLFPPDAAGRVMTDDGVQTDLYEPQGHTVLVEPSVARSLASDLPAMLALLRRNYRCEIVGHERVNDRQCAVVALCPRAQNGPYKVLWIDQSRPFTLRLEERDADGNRLYISSYDNIDFRAKLPTAALILPSRAKAAARQVMQETPVSMPNGTAKAFTLAGISGRLPAWVPRGYALLRVSLLTQSLTGRKMVQMRYSDGLKTLTVLQGRATEPLPLRSTLNGSLARYGQQAWAQDTGKVRTIVRGDLSLPPDVGQEMLRALAPQSEARLSRGLTQDFGRVAGHDFAGLRRIGWDYAQIASLALYVRLHPQNAARARALLAQQHAWPAVAHRLRADMTTLDLKARAWIVATLGH